MKKKIFMILLGILLAILSISMISSVNAIDNTNNETNENTVVTKSSVNNKSTVSTPNNHLSIITSIESKNKTNNSIKLNIISKTKNNSKTKIEDCCSSILLHVNANSYVYGYRRDSTYAANLYLKKVKLYGLEALKEYKTTNTYFFHSIIFKNGWYIGAGGTDNPSVNKILRS